MRAFGWTASMAAVLMSWAGMAQAAYAATPTTPATPPATTPPATPPAATLPTGFKDTPLSAPGSTEAAAVAPASGALPVRASTSSTPETVNIVAAIRDSDTVSTNPG